MSRNYLIAGILIVLVIALGLGVAFYSGVGPAPGGGESGEDRSEFPMETESEQESSDLTETEVTPFSFTIDEVAECGLTCRDVTATVTNNQHEEATGVTVYSRTFARENNTGTDDLVWEGKEDVGSLSAGAPHTTTTRVELSLQDGQKIDSNDGWITIQTTVASDQTTMTFQNSEQVK
ncbi:hypothetical protein [Halodesulfurarchaeum sp.]|uniref:hypothetical protein n=1 Tax=Halodesulfurarchaeum sp. TaxID=1980530 RepID=UPI001BC7D7A5|nr:hypothetical protein [Halodesulfurarchaeum sp.]